jgi:hypothetical protein
VELTVVAAAAGAIGSPAPSLTGTGEQLSSVRSLGCHARRDIEGPRIGNRSWLKSNDADARGVAALDPGVTHWWRPRVTPRPSSRADVVNTTRPQ